MTTMIVAMQGIRHDEKPVSIFRRKTPKTVCGKMENEKWATVGGKVLDGVEKGYIA